MPELGQPTRYELASPDDSITIRLAQPETALASQDAVCSHWFKIGGCF